MITRKWKKKYGFRPDDDDHLILRRIILNTLCKRGAQPAEFFIAASARNFGFDREEVLEAAAWWNVIVEDRGGVIWWRKPDVLAVLPKWDYRPAPHSDKKAMQA